MATVIGINYEALPAKLRRFAQAQAEKIRSLPDRKPTDVVRIGRLLIEARRKLGEDFYTAWLQSELELTVYKAREYRQIGERFGHLEDRYLKRFSVMVLTELSRYLVASTAAQAAIDRAKSGERVTWEWTERTIAENMPTHREKQPKSLIQLKVHLKGFNKDFDFVIARASPQELPSLLDRLTETASRLRKAIAAQSQHGTAHEPAHEQAHETVAAVD